MDTDFSRADTPPTLVLPPQNPDWPAPDPNVFDEDSWHPPDLRRRTFTGHAAERTLCRVGWMAFDSKTPAGNESEDTWASVDEAYQMLPHPLAIETIMLAHVALAHRIVWNIAQRVYPDAMRREPRYASIAEDWFSMALLKVLRVIVGDRKKKNKNKQATQGLRCTGAKRGWDRPEVDAPKQIAKYLATTIKREIWQTVEKEQKAREHTLAYLLKRQSFYKGERINKHNQGKFHKAEIVSCDGGRFVAFHEETPDKIVAEREALDLALNSLNSLNSADDDRDSDCADAACGDIFDRLLLLMKRDGATEEQIGAEFDWSRGKVQRRLKKVFEAMQGDSRLPPDGDNGESSKSVGKSKKRAKRKAPPVIWNAEERKRWNVAALERPPNDPLNPRATDPSCD